jgi:hypothetical protein
MDGDMLTRQPTRNILKNSARKKGHEDESLVHELGDGIAYIDE